MGLSPSFTFNSNPQKTTREVCTTTTEHHFTTHLPAMLGAKVTGSALIPSRPFSVPEWLHHLGTTFTISHQKTTLLPPSLVSKCPCSLAPLGLFTPPSSGGHSTGRQNSFGQHSLKAAEPPAEPPRCLHFNSRGFSAAVCVSPLHG